MKKEMAALLVGLLAVPAQAAIDVERAVDETEVQYQTHDRLELRPDGLVRIGLKRRSRTGRSRRQWTRSPWSRVSRPAYPSHGITRSPTRESSPRPAPGGRASRLLGGDGR